MPLRIKILLSLVLIAIIPLALFGVVAYATSTSNLSAVERDALKSGLEGANRALVDTQDNLTRYLRDYTQWDELHDVTAMDEPDMDWITLNLAPETPNSTFVTFNLDLLGIWNHQMRLVYNVGLTDALQQRIDTAVKGAAALGKPETMLLSSGPDIYLIGVSATLNSSGEEPNGVLLFGRKLGLQDSQAITALTGYDVALYNGTQLITGPEARRPEPAVADLEAIASGSDSRFDQERADFALALGPIRSEGGETVATLVIWRSRSALEASQEAIRTTLGVVFVVGAALAIAVALVLGTSISSPLMRMAADADLIAAGNLKHRIDVGARSGDELGRLANAFNRMTGRLAENIDELNRKVQEIDEKNHALQRANARAEDLARIRGEFMATMSHELRTPLNAIIGFSDVLMMGIVGPLNPEQRHQVERLKDNGQRLLALVNDVLDISRIEAGRIELALEPFAPRYMIERVTAQTHILADQKKINFVTEVSSDLPTVLIGDEPRIEQVIVNLLSNAFKFTEEGTVTFRVGVLPNEKTWTITVSDTGVGIPPHALSLIFEPFRQVDGSSKRAYKGSGLGLAIAQQLIQSMGGKITVESTLNLGSTFTVTLPLRMPGIVEHAPMQMEGA